MVILSQAEFDQKTKSGKNSLKKLYQEKPIERFGIFPR